MIESEVKRTSKLENGNVVIESEAREVLSVDKFKEQYGRFNSELAGLDNTITVLKNKLKELAEFEATPEIVELAKKLKVASKIVERDELKEKLKKFEKQYATDYKALQNLAKTYKELEQ